jgi:uncharacterized membrane protein YjfL (UPF0719 family)
MSATVRLLAVSVLVLSAAVASEPASEALPPGISPWVGVAGSIGGLILGAVQLVVGLSLAAFCIKKGLDLLSKLLGGLDIWNEIRKRNMAVALLGAGVVVSYTRVVGGGIDAMTRALVMLGSDPIDGVIALLVGVINLIIAIAVASFAVTIVFKVMDRFTSGIDERKEFLEGTTAIGAIYCGILIGVSGLVASGVGGIGLAIGTVIHALRVAVAG